MGHKIFLYPYKYGDTSVKHLEKEHLGTNQLKFVTMLMNYRINLKMMITLIKEN